MIAHSEAVAESIRLALSSTNPEALVSGVKSAVAGELERLNPEARIEFTNYYNHSYMADLVLRWGEGKGGYERPVYLRNSLRPVTASRDVEALESLEPVVLGLTQASPAEASMSPVRSEASRRPRVLLTDMASVATLVDPPSAPRRDGSSASPVAPLLQLVQTNFIRGGKGLVTTEEIERLTAGSLPQDQMNLNQEELARFQATASELFVEDAALRLRRAAEILRRGTLSSEELGAEAPLGGTLSDLELRVLVPYLLTNRLNPSIDYWRSVGRMMTLEMLEDLWSDLTGVDVSPLVAPNLAIWQAKRSQLVFNSEYEQKTGAPDAVATEGRPSSSEAGPWRMHTRTLTCDAGPWRVFFSTDSRRLKGREDDGVPARWDEVSGALTAYRVRSVDLRGISRRIAVRAEESSNVLADVEHIRRTIDDSFHVTELTVQASPLEDAPSVELAMSQMTATALRGTESIANLLAVSLQVLGYRRPVPFDHLVPRDETVPLPAHHEMAVRDDDVIQ